MKDYRSHLTEKQRQKIFDCFVDDTLVHTAPGSHNQKGAMEKVGLKNNKTIHRYYRYLREIIYAHQTRLIHLSGQIEIDHAKFNARQKKRYKKVDGKWVAIPTRSILVFGMLERDLSPEKRHRVFVQIVRQADKRTTQPIVRHVVDPDSTLYSDMWRAFNGMAEYTHKRVNHSRQEYARREGDEVITTATIDRFWSYCDARLGRFNGLAQSTIHLHIQECAFRYNHRHDIKKVLRDLVRAYEQPERTGKSDLPRRRRARSSQSRSRRTVHTDSAQISSRDPQVA